MVVLSLFLGFSYFGENWELKLTTVLLMLNAGQVFSVLKTSITAL